MPYKYSREIMREWEGLFRNIKEAVDRGYGFSLEMEPEEIRSMAQRIHQALANTKVYPDMFGGRYAGLRDKVKIKQDPATHSVVVKVKEGPGDMAPGLTLDERPRNEYWLVEYLQGYKGTHTEEVIHLKDSTLDQLEMDLTGVGWVLADFQRTTGGKLRVRVEKKVEGGTDPAAVNEDAILRELQEAAKNQKKGPLGDYSDM